MSKFADIEVEVNNSISIASRPKEEWEGPCNFTEMVKEILEELEQEGEGMAVPFLPADVG